MNKSRVSLLTFSRVNSFGANLQCYALCKVLSNMGFEVELLNLGIRHSLSARVKEYFYKRNAFRSRHLPRYSTRYSSLAELNSNPPKADIYMAGSDQVWNPKILDNKFINAYFLEFAPEGSRIVSYAASFGNKVWEYPQYTSTIKDLLSRFNNISVRESSGIDICRDDFGCESSVVCDPTLLLDDYSEIVSMQKRECDDLVIFSLASKRLDFDMFASFASSHNMKPVSLSNTKKRGIESRSYATIETWLESIRDAKLVITDSFHGLMFSLIFNKQFLVINVDSKKFERIRNILTDLGLTEHICETQSDIDSNTSWTKEIDYTRINKIIADKRAFALDYLQRSCLIPINNGE